MAQELTCPVCGSHNCWCDEKPTHGHRCLDCKYDGTEPIEWAAVRLCRELTDDVKSLKARTLRLRTELDEAGAEVVRLRVALVALYDATENADFGSDIEEHACRTARRNAWDVLARLQPNGTQP
jgi:hypothetical protein